MPDSQTNSPTGPAGVDWLVGGGQLGDATRNFDWSMTSLGPRESWPQSLRVAVGLCLNSRFPMFLWWGPELVSFYNDAYIPILGRRHPGALGGRATQLWSDVWPAIAPQVEAVFTRGEASWQERLLLVTNRNGFDEDAWFTYSHSPVFDELGQVAGLVCIVAEETAHVRDQQRHSFLVEINDALRSEGSSRQVISNAVGALGKYLRASRAGYGQVLPNDRDIVLEAGYTDGVEPLRGTFPLDSFGPENIALQREGVTVVHDDVSHSAANNPVNWAAIETRSFVSVPLVREGRFRASLFVNQKQPRRWTIDEVHLIEEVATRLWDALERARAEEERRRSEERFRALVTSSSYSLYRMSPDWSEMHRLDGHGFLSDTESASKSWLADYIHPDDQPSLLQAIREAVGTRGMFELEHRVRRMDGSLGWTLSRAIPLFDTAGEIIEWFGTASEVTPRKQAEQALSASEAKYRSLFESIDEGFCIIEVLFDPHERPYDYRFIEVNPAFERHTGLGGAIGRTIRELVPAHETHWFERYGRVAMTGEPARFAERADALGRFYDVYAFRIGEPADRRVAVLFNDVTARERMAQALAASEERLRQIFAQAPVAVAVFSGRELVFELANTSYREFVPGRDLVGRRLIDALPEISPELVAILNRVLDTGEPFVGHEYLVPLDRDGDGVLEDHWFTFVYQPWRQLDGVVVGIVAIAVEVSTHVRARKELEQVNRNLEEFVYVASHDLQEPLRMINIYSRLLVNSFPIETPQAAEYVGLVQQGVRRMDTLIKDLLTYSRAAHREEQPVGIADLSVALEETLSVLKSRIEETGARITSGPLPSVRGDTPQLALVFQNVLANALKYRKAALSPEIRIIAHRQRDHWVVSIRDNGIGFDQKYADRIFGLFKRLHKDEYPGTGLGLAICQRIVERFGGRMWAEGRPDEGSTFFLHPAGYRLGMNVHPAPAGQSRLYCRDAETHRRWPHRSCF